MLVHDVGFDVMEEDAGGRGDDGDGDQSVFFLLLAAQNIWTAWAKVDLVFSAAASKTQPLAMTANILCHSSIRGTGQLEGLSAAGLEATSPSAQSDKVLTIPGPSVKAKTTGTVSCESRIFMKASRVDEGRVTTSQSSYTQVQALHSLVRYRQQP